MKKLLSQFRQNLNAQIEALAGQATEQANALRTSLQHQLASLAELDKLPETELHVEFAKAAALQGEYTKSLFDQLLASQGREAAAAKSLNELNGKITAGEYVPKAKLEERCELAKEEGAKAHLAEIAELRKKAVKGLPELPENILKLPAAEFASTLADAEANLKSAQKAGLALDGTGKTFLKNNLFRKQAEFATELASLKEDGLLTGHVNLNGGEGDEGDEGGEGDESAPAPRRFRLC